jgi:hypothetical protein
MNGIGNGVAVAVEALQDDLDVVDVLRRATMEAALPCGVVDAGVHCHGSQAQGGAQADAVEGHLVNAVFHRAKSSFRCVSGVFTSVFTQLSSASRSTAITEQWWLVQS